MPGERCSTCGEARTGSFRYCLKCGFDFEPPPPEPVRLAAGIPRDAQLAAVTVEPLPAQPAAVDIEGRLVAVGPSAVIPLACPYLGLVDDPETHFMFGAPGHRCHAAAAAFEISLPHQGEFCLSGGYRACPRYPATPPKPIEPHRTLSNEHASLASLARRRGMGRVLSLVLGSVAPRWSRTYRTPNARR